MSELIAEQLDGSSDEKVLRCMQEDGPPFIFGANETKPIGTRFTLAGQPFVIVRECSEREFINRQLEIGAPVRLVSACYFEAATD